MAQLLHKKRPTEVYPAGDPFIGAMLTVFSANLEKTFGIECFSIDTKIIIYVIETIACNVKDAQYASGLSHRGFYLRLRKLISEGFIVLRDDTSDGRKRLLMPTEKARDYRLRLLNMTTHQDGVGRGRD